MNCNETRKRIQRSDYALDDLLRHHLRGCELCRSWYQQSLMTAALVREPIPAPSEGFVDRVLSQAVATEGVAPRHWRGRAAALAAVLLISATAVVGWLTLPAADDAGIMGPAEPRLVRLVIDAKDERPDALLTVELLGDLQLDGFGDRQRIEWRTRLVKGRNLLTLPVRTRSGAGGDVRVALSYDGETHTEARIPVGA